MITFILLLIVLFTISVIRVDGRVKQNKRKWYLEVDDNLFDYFIIMIGGPILILTAIMIIIFYLP